MGYAICVIVGLVLGCIVGYTHRAELTHSEKSELKRLRDDAAVYTMRH